MSTIDTHMPTRHQKHQKWHSGRLMNWAKDVGDQVLIWVQYQLQNKEHEQQAYRVCLGLLNLAKSYSAERFNRACGLANQQHLYRLQQVKDILASNQDKLYQPEATIGYQLPQHHENIRGPQQFH